MYIIHALGVTELTRPPPPPTPLYVKAGEGKGEGREGGKEEWRGRKEMEEGFNEKGRRKRGRRAGMEKG